jgi:hypothetical protein
MMEFVVAVGETLVGGVALALLFFWFSDHVFKLPQMSGLWRFELTTQETSYNPYRGMKLTYLVLLSQEGPALHGSGEKVGEDVAGVVRTYTGADRSRIEIRGYITKRYFGSSSVVLHYREVSPSRESSSMHTLAIESDRSMSGSFDSTIANSAGVACWKRGAGDLTFAGKA